VKVRGLRARPELNGKEGSLLDFDAQEGRWRVVMDDGTGLRLQPQNLECGPRPQHQGAHTKAEEEDLAAAAWASAAGGTAAVGGGDVDPGSPSTGALCPGARVRLIGPAAAVDCRGAASAEGVALAAAGTEGRWHIVMSDGSGKSIRAENLEVVGGLRKGLRVRATGLEARAELNGCGGVLVQALCEEGRWKVDMDDGSRKVFRAEHLACAAPGSSGDAVLLTVGALVRTVGLQSRPELNGRRGTLLSIDEASGRWAVRLEGDSVDKCIREANLEPLSMSPATP